MVGQGGANAAHLTDWTPHHDREVVLRPDNDRAGHRALEQVAQRCTYAGAKGVTCIEMTVDGVAPPPKWDLADDLPQGLTWAAIHSQVTAALQTLRTTLRGINPTAHITPTSSKTMDGGGWVKIGD